MCTHGTTTSNSLLTSNSLPNAQYVEIHRLFKFLFWIRTRLLWHLAQSLNSLYASHFCPLTPVAFTTISQVKHYFLPPFSERVNRQSSEEVMFLCQGHTANRGAERGFEPGLSDVGFVCFYLSSLAQALLPLDSGKTSPAAAPPMLHALLAPVLTCPRGRIYKMCISISSSKVWSSLRAVIVASSFQHLQPLTWGFGDSAGVGKELPTLSAYVCQEA